LVRVDPFSPEWNRVCDLLDRQSQPYLSHYKFSMEVARLWQVRPGSLQRQQRETAAALGEPVLLFHGTCAANVGGILREGFRVPERGGGMFGRGIYFADCPLKSVQFAQKASPKQQLQHLWQDSLACLSGAAVGLAATAPCGCACLGCLGCCGGGCLCLGAAHLGRRAFPHPQKMLVCEVFLGRSLVLRRPKKVLNSDLQRGWFQKAFGAEDYNSVYAPGGLFYAVNVPEYVVYQPYQAIPKYVIEFACRKDETEG